MSEKKEETPGAETPEVKAPEVKPEGPKKVNPGQFKTKPKEEKPAESDNPNANAVQAPKTVTSVKDAQDLFDKNYKAPEGTDRAFVTEDANVFYQAAEGEARNHAKINRLKLFTVNV